MTRPIAILRPEPGNEATAARVESFGLSALRLPLFATVPLIWTPPPADQFDALILTSANAVRLAGPGLATYAHLPVFAVGKATATAAEDAGLQVHQIGGGGAGVLAATARKSGVMAALHLAGSDHVPLPDDIVRLTIPVYASEAVALAGDSAARLPGSVLLLHSARAAYQAARLFDQHGLARADTAVAAFSPATARMAGEGWVALSVAAAPTDLALIACARGLAGR